MDKLGPKQTQLDLTINKLAYSMLGFQCMCLELDAVNTYIEVEFDVRYFQ